jgi:hypothetical protein
MAPLPGIADEVRAAVKAELAAIQYSSIQTAASAAAGARIAGAMGAFQAIASLLATKFILLISVVGGLAVALLALHIGTFQADALVAAYALLIVMPLVWLERNPRVSMPPPPAGAR